MALGNNPTLEEIVNEMNRLNNLIINRGGAQTITPKTTNQVLSKGNYKGDITVKGDVNLIASNILNGKSIFGVAGSVIAGKRWASGTSSVVGSGRQYFMNDGSSNTYYYIVIPNLSFVPSTILYISDGINSGHGYYTNNRDLKNAYNSAGNYMMISGYRNGFYSSGSYNLKFTNVQVDNSYYMAVVNGSTGSTYRWIAYE